MSAGPVALKVTFLSPIFPTDLKRQSLPFSYVDVLVSSSDGNPHEVQLYTDITAGKLYILDYTTLMVANQLLPPQNGHQRITLLSPVGNTV